MRRFLLHVIASLLLALALVALVVLAVLWIVDPELGLPGAILNLLRELVATVTALCWWLADRLRELRSA